MPNLIRWCSLIIIPALGILVYSNTFFCSFHFDDFRFIVNNFALRNTHSFLSIWQSYPCRFVTFLSLFINYHFGGLNVFGYHLFNLAVHLGAAFFVWWLTLLTLSTPAMKEDKITHHAGLIALLAGLVFVSHPLQTEAVTYIWQRAASLSALFYLVSLCLYIKSRLLQIENPSSGGGRFCYVLSLIVAVVAMFTKENAVTLPLMILLYEISFFEAKRNINWKYLAPFLITLFIIPLTMLLTETGAARLRELGSMSGITSVQYLLTQFRVVVTYIRLVFLPLNQNLDYDYLISKSILEFPTMISFLFLAGILYWAKLLFSKYRLLSFSIFWFFLTLLLESSVLPLKNVIFEHRLYLPLVGYSMFLVSGVYYVASLFYRHSERSEESKGALRSFTSLRMTVVLLTMIIACNSILTYQRNKVWREDITLWDDTVRKSPHKSRPYMSRGWAYDQQGDLIQALADLSKSIEIFPNDAKAYNNRGKVYSELGKSTQAIADYNKAIDLQPDFALAYNNRGVAYENQSNHAKAISDLTHAIGIDPEYLYAYYNRGHSYAKEGKYIQAIADYDKAIEIDPQYANAYIRRGIIYYYQANFAQAISSFTQAITLDPDNANAYYNRGQSYDKQGSYIQAIADYNKTVAVDPKFADAYNNRGIIYIHQGNYDQAISDFTKAIEINPDNTDAYHNRSIAVENKSILR